MGEVDINDAFGLASTMKSEIIFPKSVIVSRPFDLTCRVSLDPLNVELANDLWGLAGDLGKDQYSVIDLLLLFATTELDKRSIEKRNPDTKLYFVEHPELFRSGEHFDYTLEGISLPFVGDYDILARVRRQISYNDFYKDGPGVAYARLKVLADPANSPAIRSPNSPTLLTTRGASPTPRTPVNPGPFPIPTKLIPVTPQPARPHFQITKADLLKIQGKHH